MNTEIQHGDVAACVQAAKGYLKTAKWCGQDCVFMPEEMKCPFITNISFSCELFIKAIMMYESDGRTFFRGHDLKALFEKLKPTTQEIIRAAFESSRKYSKLENFLCVSRDDFENWRYAFQKDGLEADGSDYLYFADELKKYVEMLEERA